MLGSTAAPCSQITAEAPPAPIPHIPGFPSKHCKASLNKSRSLLRENFTQVKWRRFSLLLSPFNINCISYSTNCFFPLPFSVARTCNLILIVLDVLKPLLHKKLIEHELEGFGIRLNKQPPNIGFKKKDKGGINFTATVRLSLHYFETVKSILAEYKIHNADITLRSDVTADDLIDVVEGNRVYIPCIYVLNKIDQISIEELDIIYKVPHCVPISAHHRWNFDDLLEKMWDYLKLVRIYTKPKGQLPDYTSPVVLPDGRTSVEDFCLKIHKNLIKEFKYALVWGSSVKHNPQKVGKDHVMEDEDVIQLVKK
uniref:Developmentally regulated GTP binding protein 1 n=1 Tax=Xiphophorus couchianus TaxID=32473 RepID=A0A3B5L889_9TELE